MTIQTFLNNMIENFKKDISKSILIRNIFIIIWLSIITCTVLIFLCVYNIISCSKEVFDSILIIGITFFLVFGVFMLIIFIISRLINMCYSYVLPPTVEPPRTAYTSYINYYTRR